LVPSVEGRRGRAVVPGDKCKKGRAQPGQDKKKGEEKPFTKLQGGTRTENPARNASSSSEGKSSKKKMRTNPPKPVESKRGKRLPRAEKKPRGEQAPDGLREKI